jgi:hypothetical protein
MEEKIKGGYAAEACRLTGYSRTVFESAKKKRRIGKPFTKGELKVYVKYTELVQQAEDQTKLITKEG